MEGKLLARADTCATKLDQLKRSARYNLRGSY